MEKYMDIKEAYRKYIRRENRSKGMCMGLSVTWVIEGLNAMVSSKNTPFTRCEVFSFMHKEFIFIKSLQLQKTNIPRFRGIDQIRNKMESLNILAKHLSSGASVKFSTSDNRNIFQIINKMIKNPESKKGMGLIIAFTHRKRKSGHACAILCDGKHVFFLDPNQGVFRMNRYEGCETLDSYIQNIMGEDYTLFVPDRSISYNIIIQLKDKSDIKELWLPGRGFVLR